MNIFDMNSRQVGEMWDEHLDSMADRSNEEPTEKDLELWEKEHRLDPRYLKPPLPPETYYDDIPF